MDAILLLLTGVPCAPPLLEQDPASSPAPIKRPQQVSARGAPGSTSSPPHPGMGALTAGLPGLKVLKNWHRLPREAVGSAPWRSSKGAWRWAWAACAGWPCWSRGRSRWSESSHPASATLWFSDAVKHDSGLPFHESHLLREAEVSSLQLRKTCSR